MFDKTALKFILGFIAILLIAVAILLATGYLDLRSRGEITTTAPPL